MTKFLSLFLSLALTCSLVAQDASKILLNAGAPSNGVNEIQTLVIGGSTTGGTLKLGYDGFTSGAITWSATTSTILANINTALDAMPNLANGEVVATDSTLSSGNGDILLTFSGNSAKKNVNLITLTNSLTGGTHTLTISTTTAGVDATHRSAPLGTLLVDTTNKTLYQHRGTAINPTWTAITGTAVTNSASLRALLDDETGTGLAVFATTPTLTTPVIGVATATSVNKVVLTAPATAATLTIPDGVTLTGPATSGTAATLANAETLSGPKTLTAPIINAGIVNHALVTSTADGAIELTSGIHVISKAASAAAMTIAAPGAAGIRKTITTGTDFAHVVTFTGGTLWDGTATANTTWTSAAVQGSSITIVSISTTKWNVESFNLGTIAP